MRKRIRLFGVFTAGVLISSISAAQLNRTAVAVSGNDANSCAPASPCRAFARAISQTNAGGEVIALESGGYGPFTIDKNITVQAAPGVYAGITAVTGAAITVAAVGVDEPVVVRGLALNGLGGTHGIHYTAGGSLHVENCTIHGFQNYGVAFQPADDSQISELFVRGTTIRRCINAGIFIQSFLDPGTRPAQASIEHCYLDRNGYGMDARDNSVATVRHSVATDSDYGFQAGTSSEATARLILDHCGSINNGAGVRAEPGATIWVADCTLSGNGTAVVHFGEAEVLSRGNNTLAGNVSDGTFTSTFLPQ